ncbi:MAG TPA: hypothetical protein VFO04_05840 [Nitrospira sp.]|nr:hypothetical protein [Nitrospira sp.]
MDTNTNKTILRMLEVAAALVMISAGLNLFVMQTLGSFDAAAVILALFVGFWAFVLGTVLLVVSSSWLFLRRKFVFAVSSRALAVPRLIQPFRAC